jgi:MoaF C-terminal domain/MoaF N-terminal domain
LIPDLAAYRLPGTGALDGQSVELELADGGQLTLLFKDTAVTWSAAGVGDGTDPCDVVEVASGTYFVDIDITEPAHDALTVVLSQVTGWALVIHQRRDPAVTGRGPAAEHTFHVATVAGPEAQAEAQGPPPEPTRDLVGRWHRYRYSPGNLYEHVYISGDRFVSHNVDTQHTDDRADCHPVSYYRFGPDLYVVTWREFDSQASMVMVENLAQLRVTGKALHPQSAERSVSRPIGGYILPVQVIFPAGNADEESR